MAWTDAARGVLTLTRTNGRELVLAVAKSNYGPSFVCRRVNPVRARAGTRIAGMVVGLSPADAAVWQHDAPKGDPAEQLAGGNPYG